jgi:hypothetical protein
MKLVVTAALTPALSPRRGRIVRRVFSNATCWVVVRHTADETKSVTATRIEKLSSNMTVALPLPGGEGRGEGERKFSFLTELVRHGV